MENNQEIRMLAEEFVATVERAAVAVAESSEPLKQLFGQCTIQDPLFATGSDEEHDLAFVGSREALLEQYRKEAMAFIDTAKDQVFERCRQLLSEKIEGIQADLRDAFKKEVKLNVESNLMELRIENRSLLKQIEEGYRSMFDFPETPDKLEDAADFMRFAKQASGGISGFLKRITQRDAYKEAKDDYERVSLEQADNIRLYCENKMIEYSLDELRKI